MYTRIVMLLAATTAATAAAQQPRPDPRDSNTKVPGVEYRSAFEDYRRFADEELRDWRKSNDEVGAAGGHGAHRPSQGSGEQTSKPRPGEKSK